MSLGLLDLVHILAILLGLFAIVQGFRANTNFIDESQIGAGQEDKDNALPTTWKRVVVVAAGLASVGYGISGFWLR